MTDAILAFLRRSPIWIAVVLLYVVAGLVSPAMFKPEQVLNILQVTAFLGLVASGQTIALLLAGIDLSVAGVVTLTNILSTSLMMGQDERIPLATGICLLTGLAIGLVNGALVAFLRIAPIIATLAMNAILFGAALIYTRGAPHGTTSPSFNAIGQGSLFGLPASALCWLAVALLLAVATPSTMRGSSP